MWSIIFLDFSANRVNTKQILLQMRLRYSNLQKHWNTLVFFYFYAFCMDSHFDRISRKNDRHMRVVGNVINYFYVIFFFIKKKLLFNYFFSSKFVFYANRGKQNNADANRFTAEEGTIQLGTRIFYSVSRQSESINISISVLYQWKKLTFFTCKFNTNGRETADNNGWTEIWRKTVGLARLFGRLAHTTRCNTFSGRVYTMSDTDRIVGSG